MEFRGQGSGSQRCPTRQSRTELNMLRRTQVSHNTVKQGVGSRVTDVLNAYSDT